MSNILNLGNVDVKAASVQQCADCHSRNIETVKGEVDKQYVAGFVKARAGRLGINLEDYDIKVDKVTGAITATPKPDKQLEFDFE